MNKKVISIIAIITLYHFETNSNPLGRFFAATTSYALRTKTSGTARVSLYKSLQGLTTYQAPVHFRVYPLQQILTTCYFQVPHQKIYNIVLGILSKKPEKINELLKYQVIKNQIHANKASGAILTQHEPVLTTPSRWQTLTRLFKGSAEPTLAQKAYFQAHLPEALTPAHVPLKQVLNDLKLCIPDPHLYKKVLISLSTKNKPVFQRLIDDQFNQHLITPTLTKPSRWQKFRRYFNSKQEPTLAQKLYYLAFCSQPIDPCQYALKAVLENLKKQIPDPQLFKECIISLATKNKSVLQKLIDTEIKQQELKRTFNAYTHDITRAHQLLGHAVLTRKAQEIFSSKYLTIPATKQLTTNSGLPSHIHSIADYTIEILPAPNPLAQNSSCIAHFDYELYLPDTHHTAPKFTNILNEIRSIESNNSNKLYLPANAQTLTIDSSSSNLLAAVTGPNVSFNEVQEAFNQQAHVAQEFLQHTTPKSTSITTEAQLLLPSPTKLLTAGTTPTICLDQARNALNQKMYDIQQLTKYPLPTKTPIAETKPLTTSLTTDTAPKVNFNEIQEAFTHQAHVTQKLQQHTTPKSTSITTEAQLLLPSPTKLLTTGTTPTICLDQARNAIHQKMYDIQQLTKYAVPTETPIAETKLLTTNLTTDTAPEVSFNKVQETLNQEYDKAQQLINYLLASTAHYYAPHYQHTFSTNMHDTFKIAYGYGLPTAATATGIGACIWYNNQNSEMIIKKEPTYKFAIVGIGIAAAILYKILCTTSKEETITSPKNNTVIIPLKSVDVLAQNNEIIEPILLDESKLSPFDRFVKHSQSMGFTLQFVHLMQQSGYCVADVQASEILSDEQKATIISQIHYLRHTRQ